VLPTKTELGILSICYSLSPMDKQHRILVVFYDFASIKHRRVSVTAIHC